MKIFMFDFLIFHFLGRIAVCRAKASYSHRPFLVTVCVSVQYIVENGRYDPDPILEGRLDGSRDKAGSRVRGSVNGKG